ncbi:hypothetical protein JYU34_012710 [Plutella xylostella]|uniref:Uncharacterized protein n=2 Tax=Plutella xylostella TaxID=51655 RepID=A0ABQ7QDB4_PLUXY|nr:male-specific sperm protein Mst84Da [Plutella xylostella]KAG7302749.1 hypothetical protein JYU34_012710 [Plutella xylostella]CAG9094583.1 unnamed protein product [Plutella xylostella]
MPVRNCCTGCQGPMCGPCCGPCSYRQECSGVGPWCPHGIGNCCGWGPLGCMHGARGGVAGSYYSCGHGCIGGCTGGICSSCCGPSCN